MRLFVALDLPGGVRAALAAWADEAAPAVVRRVPAANLHVTLAFLGSRDEDAARSIAQLLPALARPLGVQRTADALWLPPRRPGVLTVALRAGDALGALQRDAVAALAAAIAYEPERRPFRPHVTVGRVPRGTRLDTRRELRPAAPQLSFHAPALVLYRSQTGAGGARYEALERVALG
ncbi:MAG TPA: RNA 2',3'-cyclic phosphodiesterase [Solirubrobacteraceae bacterium]|nr:RNA 2',3'-cyclic phosphodiesterase [Solirubrobacteraceae bacterium]